MEREEALARLRAARVGRLATLRPDLTPHVVPFVFVVIEREAKVHVYWVVDRKRKRPRRLQRLKNVEKNPAVEIVVDSYDEEWHRLWWVRASGTARVVRGADERATALAALRAKYPQYVIVPPSGPVVAIEIGRIAGWEAEERR